MYKKLTSGKMLKKRAILTHKRVTVCNIAQQNGMLREMKCLSKFLELQVLFKMFFNTILINSEMNFIDNFSFHNEISLKLIFKLLKRIKIIFIYIRSKLGPKRYVYSIFHFSHIHNSLQSLVPSVYSIEQARARLLCQDFLQISRTSWLPIFSEKLHLHSFLFLDFPLS